MRKIAQILFLVFAISVVASAQKIDLALTGGVYHPVNNAFSASNAFALEGNAGFRVAGVPFVALYFEIPVAGTFNSKLPLSSVSPVTLPGSATTIADSFSAIFAAPGLRLKLAPSFPISPYIAAGGGLAHFNRSSTQTTSGTSSSTSSSINKGMFDIGGGVDMKIFPMLSLRAEVRDFYSGSPELTINQITGTFNQRQHNILGTAGIVLRF